MNYSVTEVPQNSNAYRAHVAAIDYYHEIYKPCLKLGNNLLNMNTVMASLAVASYYQVSVTVTITRRKASHNRTLEHNSSVK